MEDKNAAKPLFELPERLKNTIIAKSGVAKAKLVVQKALSKTDVGRLSIQKHEIRTNFLKDEEQRVPDTQLGGKAQVIAMELIDPSGETSTVNPRKYDSMHCYSYTLTSQWKRVATKNGLELGTVVQLWAFRDATEKLCFVLVDVEKENERRLKKQGL
ncbi:hypothetical protein NMG60_11019143 [Bertholletia excelsa]